MVAQRRKTKPKPDTMPARDLDPMERAEMRHKFERRRARYREQQARGVD